MNKLTTLAVSALALVGCGSQEAAQPETAPGAVSSAPKTEGAAPTAATTVAYAEGSIKKGDKAHCAVCFAKEGKTTEEEAKETIDYKGKTYAFCNESEKAEFISEPTKYAAK